ncbi:uncharacterized protein FIBRA_04515 [Fibroporia radiculosa]|uniref:Histone H2B n=1 Tax=Fibroporia radiculosa TaxID=599839 RepID=J4HWK4_9APHY|nr:uncharacterized protein FIBRA_04515 [Fibroporia radiculosa]CCM02417.1 predicted protein [Fibroporia radiculosa]
MPLLTTACRMRVLVPGGLIRSYSTPVSVANLAALDAWIRHEKILTLTDTLRPEHLSDLYVTLPTRDGTIAPFQPPTEQTPLGYGHHLVFFHPRNPEHALRSDGTDTDFCPPEPWTRRMCAGGRIVWRHPLLIGEKAVATARVSSVEKKGFEKGSPMVFVKQKIEYRKEGSDEVAIEEERSHVYLASPGNRREARIVKDLPASPKFCLKYTPSPTTLFRFSALTFNGHYIHLDKDYAQRSEGYAERLVHGPLTALMLLDTYATQSFDIAVKSFEYRAINPLVASSTRGGTLLTLCPLLAPSLAPISKLMAPKPASTASKAPASTASKAPAKSETSKAAKKTSAKPAGPEGEKKKRRKARKETYSSYIYKVLKQVHPDTGISNKAMAILNSFVNDIFERIATEASKLASYSKKSTISSREIQTSVRLILPGELAKHAISEGTKSVTKFSSSQK